MHDACFGAQGYAFGVLSAFLSALAAVYTEWVMKRNADSLYWQNMQLYSFGVAFNALGLLAGDLRSGAAPVLAANITMSRRAPNRVSSTVHAWHCDSQRCWDLCMYNINGRCSNMAPGALYWGNSPLACRPTPWVCLWTCCMTC